MYVSTCRKFNLGTPTEVERHPSTSASCLSCVFCIHGFHCKRVDQIALPGTSVDMLRYSRVVGEMYSLAGAC
jgi:hypothetical protein